MLNNKIKRNLCLTLSIMSAVCVVDRSIRVFDGSIEWWELASTIVMTFLFTKFYLCYRKQVKRGNLYGRVRMMK